MSDLSECCYGKGFGPEGDGVELPYDRTSVEFARAALRAGVAPEVVQEAHERRVRRLMSERAKVMAGSFEGIQWPQWAFDDKPESNAKPTLPALTRQAGEKYKGLGFCDGLE